MKVAPQPAASSIANRTARAGSRRGPRPAAPSVDAGLLRTLLGGIRDVVFTTDAAGRWTFLNSAWRDVMGYDVESSLGRPFWDFMYPADREPAISDFQRLIRGEATHLFRQIRVRALDGGVRILEARIRVAPPDGGVAPATLGTLTDVTERIERERRLEQREQQLLEAQELARLGSWYLDLRTSLGVWTEGSYRIMGVSPKQFVPTYENFLSLVHPDDREAIRSVVRDCIEKRASVYAEFRIRRRDDGTERIVFGRGQPEFDDQGEVAALFGIFQDITEQRQVEASLIAARDAAEAASQAKSQFLTHMSHELRTPLNAILGFSELLSGQMLGPIGNPRYVGYAEDIHRSGRHLLQLVDDVLDMSRIEAGRYAIADEPVDLRAEIEDAVRLLGGSREPTSHRFEIRVPEPPPRLRADRRAVRQMLLNLIGNAVKFTPSGGRIEVAVAAGSDLALRVADDGIGIPASKLPEIGRPFVQVDNVFARRHKGTGIGLYITKSLVELHGGGFEIDSAPGRGTTVTLRFPGDRLLPREAEDDRQERVAAGAAPR